MPYIKSGRREHLRDFEYVGCKNAGELNFAFTEILEQFRADHGDCYQTFNDILGALDGASMEFYRRVVAPYEDLKIKENGDVYHGIEQQTEKANPPPQLRSEGVEL